MKLVITEEFHDRVADVIRKAGDILTVSEERGKELLSARVCMISPEVPEAETETEQEAKAAQTAEPEAEPKTAGKRKKT